MTGRWLAWTGGTVAALAVAGLLVYYVAAGLEEADQLASVIGSFLGFAGLGVAVYGVARERRTPPPPLPSGEEDEPAGEEPRQEAADPPEEPGGERPARSGSGDVTNTISGTVHGPAIQGRDMTFSGPIGGTLPPPEAHQPDPPAEGRADG